MYVAASPLDPHCDPVQDETLDKVLSRAACTFTAMADGLSSAHEAVKSARVHHRRRSGRTDSRREAGSERHRLGRLRTTSCGWREMPILLRPRVSVPVRPSEAP